MMESGELRPVKDRFFCFLIRHQLHNPRLYSSVSSERRFRISHCTLLWWNGQL